MLGVFWMNKVRNEEVRAMTSLQKLELIIEERRLRWFGHIWRMDDGRLPKQSMHWETSTRKRRPSRPRKKWIDIVRQDMKEIGMLWGAALESCVDRGDWRRCMWPNVSSTWDEATTKKIHKVATKKQFLRVFSMFTVGPSGNTALSPRTID